MIAGYTPTAKNFDAIVFGYYDGGNLSTLGAPATGSHPHRATSYSSAFRPWWRRRCPFANLPEARSGRWGEGLTAEKMKECRWLKPVLVGQFEFVEWTPDQEAASHYTRSSNRTTKVSDHASLSPAHRS